jgi:hypothetical protein
MQLKALKTTFEEEERRRIALEETLENNTANLEKACKKLIEVNSKEGLEADKRLSAKLNRQIEALFADVSKQLGGMPVLENPELNMLISEEIPRLRKEMSHEIMLRRELENRILEQFTEQISDLQADFIEERKAREAKEEELVNYLKKISVDIENNLHRERIERYQK